MRKGVFALLMGIMVLAFAAPNASSSQRIEQISPFGGQLFEARASAGNSAKVRVKFFCPDYGSAEGGAVTGRDYSVIFERKGKRYAYFTKNVRVSADGRCFVDHRFTHGTWTWQVWVDKDGSHSPKSNFYVDSDVPIGPLNLTRGEANRLMRTALSRKFGGNWQYGFRRRTNCRHRLGKDKMRCSPISWFVGDLTFAGQGKIWLSYSNDTAYWNFTFRITRTNEYCLSQGGSLEACSGTIVVR